MQNEPNLQPAKIRNEPNFDLDPDETHYLRFTTHYSLFYETNPIPLGQKPTANRQQPKAAFCETNPIYNRRGPVGRPKMRNEPNLPPLAAQYPAKPSPRKDLQQNRPHSGQTAKPADLNDEQCSLRRLKGKL